MKTITGMQNTTVNNAQAANVNAPDPKLVAKQVETVFMHEFLKVMMEQTSFGKDKVVSNYMPFITSELADSFSERGIGVGDFFKKAYELRDSDYKPEGKAGTESNPQKVKGNGSAAQSNEHRLSLPVEGKITSGYGLRHDPIDGKPRHHNGIDIAVPERTSITPAAAGRVVYSGFSPGYGNCVIIAHDNGLTSLYGHNSVNLVKTGDVVDKTMVIALSGSTGRSTGPHLHFELRKDGVAVNPEGAIG